ncbi:MAG: DUF3800 domain-containing protein [Nanoarchaeota archaeon]
MTKEIYIFIDESGDLGEAGSKYLIITAIWTEKLEIFDRLIKNIRRHKFRKILKKVSEIKANSSSNKLREYILKKFNEIEDFKGHAIILEKKKVFSKYLKDDKHKLYNYVCGILASTMTFESKHLVIRIDRSKGKQALRDDFDDYIKRKCIVDNSTRGVEVYHSWSHSWAGLQIVDFVSWALFQKFEYNNDYYHKLIEKKINIYFLWG